MRSVLVVYSIIGILVVFFTVSYLWRYQIKMESNLGMFIPAKHEIIADSVYYVDDYEIKDGCIVFDGYWKRDHYLKPYHTNAIRIILAENITIKPFTNK